MERTTQKLSTPSGKEFEIKTFITARERNDLRDMFLKNVSVNQATGETKTAEIGGVFMKEVEYAYISTIVTSFNGSTEDVLNRILDESPDDYDFIAAEAGKIADFKRAK